MNLKSGEKVGPWTIIDRIGEGEYGEVYSCECSEFKDKKYAMKVAKIEKNRFKASLISHEVQLLRIRLRAFSQDLNYIPHFPYTKSTNYITGDDSSKKIRYLVMERFDMSLRDYFSHNRDYLSKEIVYIIAAQLINILFQFHKKNIVHNDVKPENYLLRKTDQGYTVVAIDLGAASFKLNNKETESVGMRGTPLYMSINSESEGSFVFSPFSGVDVYYSDDMTAVGYMLAYLVLGHLPWEKGKSNQEIIAMKKQQPLNDLLQSYPELLSLINEFEFKNTDTIDYKYWVSTFSKYIKAANPSHNMHFIPFTSESLKPSEKDLAPIGEDSKPTKRKGHHLDTIPSKVQRVINNSRHSTLQNLSVNVTPSNSLVNEVHKIERRVQPSRTCKKR